MTRITQKDLAIRPSFLSEKDAKPTLVGCDIVGRFTDEAIGTVYSGKNHDAVALAGAFAAVPHLVAAAEEAILQIRYLHEKFQATGSGEGVLQRLEAALAMVDRPTFSFDNDGDERTYADLAASTKSDKS
jgi:hypothetical protein